MQSQCWREGREGQLLCTPRSRNSLVKVVCERKGEEDPITLGEV